MVLPAKSIICMPCHAGTFSVGDTTTILSLIVFFAGLVMVFSYVLTGASSFSSLPGGMVGSTLETHQRSSARWKALSISAAP